MDQDKTRILNLLVIGLAFTVGLLVGAWFLLPHPASRSPEELYREAEQELQAGDYLAAEDKARLALERTPEDARLHYALGQAQDGLQLKADAEASFARAAKLDPQNRDYLFESGSAALENRREEAAEQSFAELVRRYPQDLPALYQLGALAARRGRYAEAAKYFEAIVAAAPAEAEAWNNLAFCYHNLGRTPEALSAADQALKLRPDFAQARTNREIIQRETSPSPLPKK